MHLVLAAFSTLLFVLSIAFGATAFGKRFRVYSIATIVIVLAFGALTGMDASKISENEPTPWVGISERIAVFGSMLWIAVFATALLRFQASPPAATRGQS
jgi:peptidoglycan/LPS O-acetylase OafA/YrhL